MAVFVAPLLSYPPLEFCSLKKMADVWESRICVLNFRKSYRLTTVSLASLVVSVLHYYMPPRASRRWLFCLPAAAYLGRLSITFWTSSFSSLNEVIWLHIIVTTGGILTKASPNDSTINELNENCRSCLMRYWVFTVHRQQAMNAIAKRIL